MNAAESPIGSGGIQNNTNNLDVNGCIDSKHCEPLRIVRQYINPAVYVESSVYDMAPFRRSPVFLNYSSDDEYIHKVVKVKKCVCFTNPNHCPCHPMQSNSEGDIDCECNEEKPLYKDVRARSLSSQVSLCSDTDSKITVKKYKKYQDELKLSLPSTSTSTLRYADDNQKEEAYKNWCARKDQEKKLKDEKESLVKEIKEREKELQLQQERENFKRWLTRKKKEEEKRKKEKEKELEDERMKQELKEKRLQENELNYQLWLKKKEELYLERKIQEHMKLLKAEEEKQRRLYESVKAYEEWLRVSKYKPKPIPLNQGLQTLRSSVSVTYVNPTPWVPNIDLKPKPASQ
ncbi:ny-ren-41 antigen l15 -related [Holotrichia oblita]|uniref:Ny-ren-41 antigen l15 -related n=1 Tax=Holotrichia oblita TaxID=644536 RepID=A0ACB9T2V5_HOLOL|nr:ny-ren-41 antigen l15 -related [Holotrichia oblita]